MSNNSLRVPNNSLKVQNDGVFSSVGAALLILFLMIGWPIIAIILIVKGSVEGYKARQAPPPPPAPPAKNKWKYYLGWTMLIIYIIMVFAILAVGVKKGYIKL
jgi:hypothetical protein